MNYMGTYRKHASNGCHGIKQRMLLKTELGSHLPVTDLCAKFQDDRTIPSKINVRQKKSQSEAEFCISIATVARRINNGCSKMNVLSILIDRRKNSRPIVH